MTFGELLKNLRIAQKKTLRQFCLEHGHDPSNWSKLERGVNRPSHDGRTVARWARQLGLKPGTEQWQDFMERAKLASNELPKSVLSNEELMKKLPAFFCTVQGTELGENELQDLIVKIKETHTPDE